MVPIQGCNLFLILEILGTIQKHKQIESQDTILLTMYLLESSLLLLIFNNQSSQSLSTSMFFIYPYNLSEQQPQLTMSSQHQVLSQRIHSLISESNKQYYTHLAPFFNTIWSSISSHNDRLEIIEEQLTLISSRAEINSQLSQKVSIDEMMDCLESVNNAIAKKMGQKQVIEIFTKHSSKRESQNQQHLQKCINLLKIDILKDKLETKQKIRDLETRGKSQNDTLCFKIHSLREQIDVKTRSICDDQHKISTKPCETYPDQQQSFNVDYQHIFDLYENNTSEINYLKSKQQEMENQIERVTEIGELIEKIKLQLLPPSRGQRHQQTSISLRQLSLIHKQLLSRIKKLEQSYEESTKTSAHEKPIEQLMKKQNYVKTEQFERLQKQMNLIFKNICYESIVGRWGCRNIEGRNCANWEHEMINTLQDNFIWSKNSKSILIKSRGIYQIRFFGFSSSKSKYRLRVNGEVSQATQGSNRIQNVLCLLENTKISMQIQGKCDRGVLCIKRL